MSRISSSGRTSKSATPLLPVTAGGKRLRQAQDKKISEDEFMAAAIGDLDWLKQSFRLDKGLPNVDKNVS